MTRGTAALVVFALALLVCGRGPDGDGAPARGMQGRDHAFLRRSLLAYGRGAAGAGAQAGRPGAAGAADR